MKDIKITVKRQKTELITLLVCIVIAVLFNVYAIIAYDGKWSEIFSTAGYTLVFGVLIYLSWSAFRVAFSILKHATKLKNKK
ncbi:MAG: hypothetical protein II793_07010 [Bacteroidales bacterium]|jgi:hypothetical protein|nr:hypothetical protein [Bacteroidales bacterium]